MYSVLLVDDEKIIREGIYELLSMADLDLDLTMAASAVEALSILEERKIDIVLSDICMPQMSGLDLYDAIREKWPRCKMIFLTGHDEFDFVYKVHQHARYVLKAEEDEKILEAVRESISEIDNDLLLEQMSRDSTMHQHRSNYYERLLLFRELVEGSISSSLVTQEMMDRMDAKIDLSRKMYCVMIRYAAVQRLAYEQQVQAIDSLTVLIEELFLKNQRGTFFGYNKHLTYLLLQPEADLSGEKVVNLLEGQSELFQKAVTLNLDMPVSVCIDENSVDFHQAIHGFSAIRDQMVSMTEDEIRVCNVLAEKNQEVDSVPEAVRRECSDKVRQMEDQFDNMDYQGILSSLVLLREQLQPVRSMNDLFVLELYCSVCKLVLSHTKKMNFSEDTARSIGLMSLYNLSRYPGWGETFDNLKHVVELVSEHVDTSIENRNQDVINKTKQNIKGHLDGDTSLYALSVYVHLCPEHLLRVFKRHEGITVLQYINDLKLARAKQMLSETDIQIREIAERLGFTSAGYFGRFFKSKAGTTPNLYREQQGKLRSSGH